MAATGFGMKFQWISRSMITGAYPYKLFIEVLNGQYVDGGPDSLSNKRRHGGSFSWRATNATGTPGSIVVTLINSTASYV